MKNMTRFFSRPAAVIMTFGLAYMSAAASRTEEAAATTFAYKPRIQRSLNAGLGVAPDDVRRDSPRETVMGFIDACRAGRYETAAHYLDLGDLPVADQRATGARLARRFKFVLDQKLWIDPDDINDDPQGRKDDGLDADYDRIGTIALTGGEQDIRVQRRLLPDGEMRAWVFSRSVVRSIDSLYGVYGIGWLGDRLPSWTTRVRLWEFEIWQLFALLMIAALAYFAAGVVAYMITVFVRRAARRTRVGWDDDLSLQLPRPLRFLLWILLINVAAMSLRLSEPASNAVAVLLRSGMLAAFGLFAHRAVSVLARHAETDIAGKHKDERKRKAMATQISVLRRIAGGFVIFIMAAVILAQFRVVRSVGLSLLASAGLAGVVLGFAAQRSVANLFAGIQIMLTQPIRIGDVVVVEGEWGSIEEITFTHVIVKIWDLRRLVLPISYFLERPFQNWTRASTDLLGTIYFYADHTVDIDAMRAELDRILAATDLWDGKAKGVVVTDVKERVVEVRALISAADSGRHWDLRCLVREKLLDWLQREGKYLPTFRLTMRDDASRIRLERE
ncbi:MAG: mechanosensitive ion channel [Vicinamibacteria bacterium]|nr:mechanosensitive ion channel [Vicinamibacteria bacterium]